MTFKKINMVNIALTLMAVFTVSYSSEIDKRKIPQVTLGAVSSTAIITGWSLYFVGNYLQDKNTDLYENASDIGSVIKYLDKRTKAEKIWKGGHWTHGFGGLFLGVSFLWRYCINKSDRNKNSVQSNTILMPVISYDNCGIILCYPF